MRIKPHRIGRRAPLPAGDRRNSDPLQTCSGDRDQVTLKFALRISTKILCIVAGGDERGTHLGPDLKIFETNTGPEPCV